MGLPVEVPGLDTIIPQVADGRVFVAESGPDGVKSFFARTVARTALRAGRPVTYVTSLSGPEISSDLLNGHASEPTLTDRLLVKELDTLVDWNEVESLRGLLVIDSFSFLALDLSSPQLTHLLRRIRATGQTQELTAVLATDRGMLDGRSEAILGHLSDGWIQFQTKEGPDGLTRYLRIPKWTEGMLVDRNVYYDYDGKRLAIDLRRRVL